MLRALQHGVLPLPLVLVVLFASAAFLAIGCMAWGAKKAERQAGKGEALAYAALQQTPEQTSTELLADTVPPILSQKKNLFDGILYVIDTTKCKLTPEQFMQRYSKWMGLNENNTLKIDTFYTQNISNDEFYKGLEWSYTYRYYFKGIPVGQSTTRILTGNKLVACVEDWRKNVPNTIDVSVNFTPRQVQDMVAELVRKENIADIINLDTSTEKTYGKKWNPADFAKKDSVIATVGKGTIGMYSSEWQLIYNVRVWFSDDGDIIVERTMDYSIDPITGKIISKSESKHGTSYITYICTTPCTGSVGTGGITANLVTACSAPALPLYNDCGNAFNTQVNLAIPTIGNKAFVCPPPPPAPELYDDVLTCRDVELTRQNTCNANEYNYVLQRTDPPIHAYHYQPAMGVESNMYEGDHVKFPGNPNYIFKENVLSATSAYWNLDIAQTYFEERGINSYDDMGSPIEVVVGRPGNVKALWTQYIAFPNNTFPPAFVKQIFIENMEVDTDFEYAKLNVLAHEYTHAVLANYFGIVGTEHVVTFPDPQPSDLQKAETAALHEGLADIFAVLVLEKARHDELLCNSAAEQSNRWLMRIDHLSNRRLDNPALTVNFFGIGQATYYNSPVYHAVLNNATYEGYLPYYRAGIIGYWFYLATEGSTTPVGNIGGICGQGIDIMEDVLFATMGKCKSQTDPFVPTFEQFCALSLDAVDQLYASDESTRKAVRSSVLKAWHAVGLCLTVAGKTDDEQEPDPEHCYVDLRMRDNFYDEGWEPNLASGVDADGGGWSITSPWDWEDIWDSPDLWNCPDGNNCDVSNWGNPEVLFSNRIGFTVYNSHFELASEPAEMHLYYSMANTGEIWPEHWNDFNILDELTTFEFCAVGDEIVNSPRIVPSIPAQSYYTDWVSWTPPNFIEPGFALYRDPAGCGLIMEEDDSDGQFKYELCLLARLESAADPIFNEAQDVPIRDNVFNSNNVVTRNTFLVSPFVGGGGLPPIVVGQPSVILVYNNNVTAENLDVTFDAIGGENFEQIDDLLQISWILGPDLWGKWESTGKQGQGVEIIAEREVKITNYETAKLLNIPFDAKEFAPIAIKVTILSSSSKRGDLNILPQDFRFRISHRSSTGSPINKPSNCLFTVKDIARKSELASTFASFSCYPTVFDTETRLSFQLPSPDVVRLTVHDLQGKVVMVLADNALLDKGEHVYSVSGIGLPSGMYICTLSTSTGRVSRKMVKV